MKRIVEAVFRGGVFRPLRKIRMSEGKRVKVSWEESGKDGLHPLLEMAAEVYRGLSADDLAEVEKIALDRRGFAKGRAKS